MQITVEELTAEAGQLALEVRLKDKAIAALEAENTALRDQIAKLEVAAATSATPSGDPVRDKRSSARQAGG